jgi:hypothetical protein
MTTRRDPSTTHHNGSHGDFVTTAFEHEDYLWNGLPLRGLCGLCGLCGVHVGSTDPNHRVTSIVRGGRGVECVLRGDIHPTDAGPLR